MEHLVQRQSGYYFRLIVPPDLKPIFRKNEIKRSLKTGSLTLAKERAFLLSGRLKKLFRQMRSQGWLCLGIIKVFGKILTFSGEFIRLSRDIFSWIGVFLKNQNTIIKDNLSQIMSLLIENKGFYLVDKTR